jgi:DNA polymerase III subunit epsilon
VYSRGLPQLDQPVAFTGCDPIERAQLEGRAIAAGLRVTETETAKTATLVTDGANPNAVKARRVRDLGTRFASPDVLPTCWPTSNQRSP